MINTVHGLQACYRQICYVAEGNHRKIATGLRELLFIKELLLLTGTLLHCRFKAHWVFELRLRIADRRIFRERSRHLLKNIPNIRGQYLSPFRPLRLDRIGTSINCSPKASRRAKVEERRVIEREHNKTGSILCGRLQDFWRLL